MQNLNKFSDDRGILVPLEFSNLPFTPKRVFYVYGVPKDTWRGEHAHYRTEQFLICLKGQILVRLESKKGVREITLDEGGTCFIDKMVWDSQKFLADDSVLLVLCSTNFDKSDYIFDKNIILK